MPAAGSCSVKGCVLVQNDNLKRFFCFLLCFVLLISCIPRPAHAVGVDWILRQIATDIGVSAILEGLGIFRDAASDYFGELVDEVSDALDTAGLVSSGLMNAYYKVDPLGAGSPLFSVPLSLISFVRNWVFENTIVTSTAPIRTFISKGSSYGRYTLYTDAVLLKWWSYQSYSATVNLYQKSEVLVSLEPGNQTFGGYQADSIISTNLGNLWYYSISGSSSYDNKSNFDKYVEDNMVGFGYIAGMPSLADVFNQYGASSFIAKPGLSLGYVAPSDTLFNAAYPQWLEHQRELEDGTTETVVQIGLGNTQAETESLTQEQIWSGQGTLTVPEVVPGTATLTDVISAIVALPGQLVTSISTALTNFFTISGEASSFGIQLKDFFPFCIPFDLFDFLTVLSAEPQAPVFKWEIPVPQLGRTFEFEVDLSPWDPVAAVFRTFELLAFIVGLALITREKFLRS